MIKKLNENIYIRWKTNRVPLNSFLLFLSLITIISGCRGLLNSEDNFANNLIIPEGIEIFDPTLSTGLRIEKSSDTFQELIFSTLASDATQDSFVSVSDTLLEFFMNDDNSILFNYLSACPAWRVFSERGHKFATRRWIVDSIWHYNLHGYYTKLDFFDWSDSIVPLFQCRTTIGIDGKPWANVDDFSSQFLIGDSKEVNLRLGYGNSYDSEFILSVGKYTFELYEQSPNKERILTKAMLQFLDNEFENPDNLTQGSNCSTAYTISDTVFELYGARGIYNSFIKINPGESGMLYLKAYEITQNTQLSSERLKQYSNEWIGWSENPSQLFYSNTHFTIYEGDWGKPYAARFEVWFVPDSGEKERKLTEKIFKIEGWQR